MESLYEVHQINTEDNNQVLLKLNDAIEQLKSKQKECIELFYLQEKSYIEIAELTGYEIKKVKSYIQNGKRNLKIFLEKMKQTQ